MERMNRESYPQSAQDTVHKNLDAKDSTLSGIKHLFASRVIILAIVLFTQGTADISRGKACQYMNLDGSLKIHQALMPSTNLLKADIGWYKAIADSGYSHEPFYADGRPESQRNWAFFPGWPMLWKLAGLGNAHGTVGLALANFLFIGGMAAMGRYLRDSGLVSSLTLPSFFLAASYYPFSYFFSLPLPESLFAACTAFFLVTLPTDKFQPTRLLFNLIAGFALGITRPTGILSSIFPLAEICKCLINGNLSLRNLASLTASAISPFLGVASFMAHLYHQTGNPFAFKDIQEAWGRSTGLPFEGLLRALSPEENLKLTHYSNFRIANLAVCILMIICLVLIAKNAVHNHKKGMTSLAINQAAIAIYLATLIALGSSDNQTLLSFAE